MDSGQIAQVLLVLFVLIAFVFGLHVWWQRYKGQYKDKALVSLTFLRDKDAWPRAHERPLKEYVSLIASLTKGKASINIDPGIFSEYFISPAIVGTSPSELNEIRKAVCIHELGTLRANISARPLDDYSADNYKAVFSQLGLTPSDVPGLTPPDNSIEFRAKDDLGGKKILEKKNEDYWLECEVIIRKARIGKIAEYLARYRVSRDRKDFFNAMHVYFLINASPHEMGFKGPYNPGSYEFKLFTFITRAQEIVDDIPVPDPLA